MDHAELHLVMKQLFQLEPDRIRVDAVQEDRHGLVGIPFDHQFSLCRFSRFLRERDVYVGRGPVLLLWLASSRDDPDPRVRRIH